MADGPRQSLLDDWYARFLHDQDAAALVDQVARRYTIGTLERLARQGQRLTRRAAVFVLGYLGDFSSNHVVGAALIDDDRGVRLLAETAVRALWCRDGSPAQRRLLETVIRCNVAHRYAEAVKRASELIAAAPELAEAWNQRAIALFGLGRYRESIRDCRQAMEFNAYHFGAATGMGQCYLQLGEGAAALEALAQALRLNPGLEGVRAHVQYLRRARKQSE